MLADFVKCNNCGSRMFVEREQDTCPICKTSGVLADIDQDIEVPDGCVFKNTKESDGLFNELLAYTHDAASLNKAVTEVIEPIIDKWLQEGYSIVEIESVVYDAIFGCCVQKRIDIGASRLKKCHD